jgi:predicted acylesterase/phospholipase RssA
MESNDIALVLPGGGAWMFAQAHELLTIFDARPDLLGRVKLIACNSAGSITAALLAAGIYRGQGTAVLREAMAEVKQDTQIITPSLTRVLAAPILHPIDGNRVLWGALLGSSAVSQQPLWDLLEKYAGGITTADLQAKVGLNVQARSFHSETGEGRVWEGYLANLPKKSSAIEGVFMDHDGDSDGGPFDNCPADLAIAQGFSRILIAYCGPESPAVPSKVYVTSKDDPSKPKLKARAVVAGTVGALTQMNEQIAAERLAAWQAQGGRLVEAYPAQDAQMGSILDFSEAAQGPRIEAGKAAGALALKQIEALGW